MLMTEQEEEEATSRFPPLFLPRGECRYVVMGHVCPVHVPDVSELILVGGLHDVLALCFLPGQCSTAFCGADYWAVVCRCAGAGHHQGGCRPCGYCISGIPGFEHEQFRRDRCDSNMYGSRLAGLVAPFSDVIEVMLTVSCRSLSWVWCFDNDNDSNNNTIWGGPFFNRRGASTPLWGVESRSLPRRWPNPIPALPPFVVKTPHLHGAPTMEETSFVKL